MKKVFFLLLSVLFFSLTSFFASGAAEEDNKGYVGDNVCKDCHEQQIQSLRNNLHWKKTIKNSPAAVNGCESCHGSGAAHVSEAGGTTKDLTTFSKEETAKQKSSACLNCHEESEAIAFWDSGAHKRNDVTCTDCHSIHSGTRTNLKASEPNLCLTCHKDVRSLLNRQAHHPIREGKVKCTDCHTPHGGPGPKMINADSVPDLCYKCHTEKRGPFAFEHPPVAENCLICHQPHGSNHESLLTSKPPRLCQDCHTPNGHNNRPYSLQNSFRGFATSSRNRFVGEACLNCHGDIHGSNRSPYMVR